MKKHHLHKAAQESDYDFGKRLIESKVDLNEIDEYGNTALHWAVLRGDIFFVKMLLEASADPNIFSSDGITARWTAIDFGLVEIDRLLLKYGGKVLTNNNFNRAAFTALKNILGQSLPVEDSSDDKIKIKTEKSCWWKFW